MCVAGARLRSLAYLPRISYVCRSARASDGAGRAPSADRNESAYKESDGWLPRRPERRKRDSVVEIARAACLRIVSDSPTSRRNAA
jgi:hypothetical protein